MKITLSISILIISGIIVYFIFSSNENPVHSSKIHGIEQNNTISNITLIASKKEHNIEHNTTNILHAYEKKNETEYYQDQYYPFKEKLMKENRLQLFTIKRGLSYYCDNITNDNISIEKIKKDFKEWVSILCRDYILSIVYDRTIDDAIRDEYFQLLQQTNIFIQNKLDDVLVSKRQYDYAQRLKQLLDFTQSLNTNTVSYGNMKKYIREVSDMYNRRKRQSDNYILWLTKVALYNKNVSIEEKYKFIDSYNQMKDYTPLIYYAKYFKYLSEQKDLSEKEQNMIDELLEKSKMIDKQSEMTQ